MRIFRKIINWIRWDLKNFPREVKTGITNLIKWSPVIWRDRNFDHTFIFEILKFKIELTSKSEFSDREIETMNTCVRLISLIQEEHYLSEAVDAIKCDYLNSDGNFIGVEEGLEKFKSEIEATDFSSLFQKYPKAYKMAKLESEGKSWDFLDVNDYTLALWICRHNHKKAKRILFSILENRIENWWN
jgi:hypothetical protein